MWAVLLQKAGLGSTSSTMESDMEAEVEKFEENAIKTIPLKDADDIGEKTKKTELLKGVEADKDKWILTRRKQIIRGEKFKHHKLKVFGGPAILKPRHRTAKKAKVLFHFAKCKSWVRKVKKFQRQNLGAEQRATQKQELAKAKVLAWLDGIEVEDWKSQMLHVLGRAV